MYLTQAKWWGAMRHILFETERTLVRSWDLADVESLYAIMSDHRVHIHTGDSPWSKEHTEAYIRHIMELNFRTLELFHAGCFLKNGIDLIGLTGLNPYLEKCPEIEWQLGVDYWGQGYATEIGRATIANAFASTNLLRIYGMANPENRASQRVMEKVGMKCLGLQEFRGHMDMFYSIDRDDT